MVGTAPTSKKDGRRMPTTMEGGERKKGWSGLATGMAASLLSVSHGCEELGLSQSCVQRVGRGGWEWDGEFKMNASATGRFNRPTPINYVC